MVLLAACVLVFLFIGGAFAGLRVAGSVVERLEGASIACAVLALGLLGGSDPLYPYVEVSTGCAGLFFLVV